MIVLHSTARPAAVVRAVIVLAMAATMAGCTLGGSDDVYLRSAEVDPIRAPDGLDQPRVRGTFQVAGYALPEMAGQNEDRPPRVLTSAEAEASRSRIRFGQYGLYLEVEDELSSVWRRLGFTLNRGDMKVESASADEHRYAFAFDPEPIVVERRGLARFAFWEPNERLDHGGRFVLELEPESEDATRVLLLDENGELIDMARAEYVLSILRDRLG
ncbi:MAG: hypothetical protein V2J20_00585 [Wenzhouxiangella sp.]|nr:hypothetical protein [Wenzhouxiangella sp.]